MSARRFAAAITFAACTVSTATAADVAAVKAAIEKGANYLKQVHAPAAGYAGGEHGVGTAALAGLAMIEAGVKKDDPSLLNILQYVRTQSLIENKTYRIAAGLIFLDKYNDPHDVPLIQVLGVRLYAGMNVSAGWTYACGPEIPAAEGVRLAAALSKAAPPSAKLHPEALRMYRAVRAIIAATGRSGGADDNSNTQFGLVGLWVSARHGVPVRDAIVALEARFLRTQNRASGGWGYTAAEAPATAMTCAGLMGLAAGSALRESAKTGKAFAPANPGGEPAQAPEAEKAKPPAPADAFANPRSAPKIAPAPEKPEDEPEPEAEAANPALRNAAVQAALMAIGRVIAATPHPGGAVPPNGGAIANFVGHGNYFYLLWSVERVGVTYGLETIGDVNWYDWGANYFLNGQADTGAWGTTEPILGPTVNTPFAMLFLCKANLIGDLSRNIKGKHKDPGRSELRGGGPPPLTAPSRPEPAAPVLPPEPPPESTAVLPEVKDLSEIANRANRLLAAGNEEWKDRLIEVRDSKGPMNTLALARAVAGLEGVRRKDAREALAERFVRMTPATIRGLLRDQDPEIRRAAVLACAMKEDVVYVPDLIERLTDPSDMVGRAARASLRVLTEKDYGPETGATAEAKVKAAEDWRAWYATHRPVAK